MSSSIRIRLARHGLRNQPYYHVVAISAHKARGAMPLEKIGEYDPIPRVRNTDFIPSSNRVFGHEHAPQPKEKQIEWNVGRLKWWLAQGAEPTKPVVKLLEKSGIIEPGRHTRWIRRADIQKFRQEASPPLADLTQRDQQQQAQAKKEAEKARATLQQLQSKIAEPLGVKAGLKKKKGPKRIEEEEGVQTPAGEMTGFQGKVAS